MAVFPVAPGNVDYSSTSSNGFIPAVWSSKLVINYYAATAFSDIFNSDYEGEIKAFGDSVEIRTTPAATVNTYVKGQKLTYEQVESAKVTLKIDKGRYTAFAVDHVDKKQMDVNYVNEVTKDAALRMKISIDTEIINDVYTDAAAANKGTAAGALTSGYNVGTTGSPVTLTKSNILEYIVDCGSILTEQNVPEDEANRWILFPTWAANLLQKSDLKNASFSGDDQTILRNPKGKMGMLGGFTIYFTNNYTAVATNCYNILFGHKIAGTFASQFVETETLKNPDTFGDLIRSLNVYGYEVVKPAALGVLYATKGL